MVDLSALSHLLITFCIFLSFTLFVRKSLSLPVMVGAFACAAVTDYLDVFVRFSNLTSPESNPQFVIVSLLLASFFANLSVALWRRTRSLDRVIMSMASAAVLTTTLLFHTLLVQTILPAWAKDSAWGNSYLLPAPITEFVESCKRARLVCWTKENIEADQLPESYKYQVSGLYEFYRANPTEDELGHGFGIFNDLERDGVAVVLYHELGDEVRVIADSRTGQRIHSTVRDIFYTLAAIAHTVWLSLALILIVFHRRRFARRNASVS